MLVASPESLVGEDSRILLEFPGNDAPVEFLLPDNDSPELRAAAIQNLLGQLPDDVRLLIVPFENTSDDDFVQADPQSVDCLSQEEIVETELFGGRLVINHQERYIIVDGEKVSLAHKALQVLECLARNHGHLIRHDVIVTEVWGEGYRDKKYGNLRVNVNRVREALGGLQDQLENVRQVGYRLDYQASPHNR